MTFSDIIKQLVAVAQADLKVELLPPLAAFFTSIAANPSQANVVAQLGKLEATAIAALPGLESAEIAALGTIIETEAGKLLTPK